MGYFFLNLKTIFWTFSLFLSLPFYMVCIDVQFILDGSVLERQTKELHFLAHHLNKENNITYGFIDMYKVYVEKYLEK